MLRAVGEGAPTAKGGAFSGPLGESTLDLFFVRFPFLEKLDKSRIPDAEILLLGRDNLLSGRDNGGSEQRGA